MRTKPIRPTASRRMIMLTLIFLAALGTTLAAPARDPVSGSGNSVATSEITFAGTMDLRIRGQEYEVSFVATLLGPPVPSDEGVLHGMATHTIDFGDGNTLVTLDKAVLEPTDIPGLFTLNEKLRVVSGTGAFAGAKGDLHAHGMIHLIEGWAEFDICGSVSHVDLD